MFRNRTGSTSRRNRSQDSRRGVKRPATKHHRTTLELLEDRHLLSGYGDAVLAVFEGEVTDASQPASMSFEVDPDEFQLTDGDVILGFYVTADEGSGLEPRPAEIHDAAGQLLRPVSGPARWAEGDESMVLFALGSGSFQIDVTGANGTTGGYHLAVSLAGDFDGDRAVTREDGQLIRERLNKPSSSDKYDVDADVNLDGRITGFDLSLQVRNLGTSTTDAAALTFAIDPSLAPADPDTGRVVDASGMPIDFSTKELILMTSDDAKLDAFVARWNGEVEKTYDPQEYGVDGLEKIHLVKVDVSEADETEIAKDLKSLDPNAQGAHKVSSTKALKVLSVAAKESAEGNKVAVNYKFKPDQFLDRTTIEAPNPGGGTFDAFALPHLAEGDASNQDIGVAEAWRVLELAGQLDQRVDIAILDQGFAPNLDWPADFDAYSTVLGVPPLGTAGEGDSPWHGTDVVSAAMALADNGYGSAGTAGAVAHAITVVTDYNVATAIAGVLKASLEGADIINMSFGARVPAALSPTVVPFDLTTLAVRNAGKLIFASAGNDNQNIDEYESVFGIDLWEKAWHAPAENAGVIAVGALGYNSQARASFSNFGTKQLDIYAPGVIELGPDPGNPGNIVQTLSGTSFASPFAAGVAALIWAANPSLSANAVEGILYDTAVQNPHPSVNRYVNALDAVLATIGDVPPYVKITGPADGSSFSRGTSVPLNADREDYEDGLLNVVWTSDRDGVIGSSPSLLSYGTHVITATVTDSAGQSSSDSITIEIVNDLPEVQVIAPLVGATLYSGSPVQLLATSHDVNEPSQMLPDSAMVWTSSIDGELGTGHNLITMLSPGDHLIGVTGTDSQGGSSGVFITVHVIEPTGGLPTITFVIPTVEDPSEVVILLTGADEMGFYADVRLVADVTDPEQGPLTGSALQWSISESMFGPYEALGEGDTLETRLYADESTGDIVFVRLTATDDDEQSVSLTLRVRLFGLI